MSDKIDLLDLHLVGGRLTDEPSHALERHKYGDPARHVKFSKLTRDDMDRMSNKEIADSLLMEWHRWCKAWRPALGAPRASVCTREYRADEKHNEETEDQSNDRLYLHQMGLVDFCVDAIEVAMQQAIGTEMKNREARAKVWRSPSNRTYSQALDAIIPFMRRKGLFD